MFTTTIFYCSSENFRGERESRRVFDGYKLCARPLTSATNNDPKPIVTALSRLVRLRTFVNLWNQLLSLGVFRIGAQRCYFGSNRTRSLFARLSATRVELASFRANGFGLINKTPSIHLEKLESQWFQAQMYEIIRVI